MLTRQCSRIALVPLPFVLPALCYPRPLRAHASEISAADCIRRSRPPQKDVVNSPAASAGNGLSIPTTTNPPPGTFAVAASDMGSAQRSRRCTKRWQLAQKHCKFSKRGK